MAIFLSLQVVGPPSWIFPFHIIFFLTHILLLFLNEKSQPVTLQWCSVGFLFVCLFVGEAQTEDDLGLVASLVSLQDILMLVLRLHFPAKMTWLKAELGPSILYRLRVLSVTGRPSRPLSICYGGRGSWMRSHKSARFQEPSPRTPVVLNNIPKLTLLLMRAMCSASPGFPSGLRAHSHHPRIMQWGGIASEASHQDEYPISPTLISRWHKLGKMNSSVLQQICVLLAI